MNARAIALVVSLAVGAAGCVLVTHFDRDDSDVASVVDGGFTTIAPFTIAASVPATIDVTAPAKATLTLTKSAPEPLHVTFALPAGVTIKEGAELDIPADAATFDFTVDVAHAPRGKNTGTITVKSSDGSLVQVASASFTVTGPGDLDPTFGTNGVIIVQAGTHAAPRVRQIVLDGDRVLMVGSLAVGSAYRKDWALARLTASGPDPSFGDGGIHVDSVGYSSSEAQTAILGSGGSLLVSGAAQYDGGGDNYQTWLRRYDSTGQYLGAGDGVAVGVGRGDGDDTGRPAMMARDGTRTWTVAVDGYNVRALVAEVSEDTVLSSASTAMPLGIDLLGVAGEGGDNTAGDLAIVGGRLLLTVPSEFGKNTSVVAYGLSGSGENRVDKTFGASGVTVDSTDAGSVAVYGLVPRANGSFVAVGAHGGSENDLTAGVPLMITRAFDTKGRSDTTTTANLESCPGSLFRGVTDAKGRLVTVGYSGGAAADHRRIAVIRLLEDGTVDTTFGGPADGHACMMQLPGAGSPTFGGLSSATASAVAIDSTGRVLVGGWGEVDSVPTSYVWFVARFRGD